VSGRALSFGSAAWEYERFRPAYPGAVVDEVLAYAGHAVATALEIGAGTGKATRMFAALFLLAALGVSIFFVLALLEYSMLRKWHESALKKEL